MAWSVLQHAGANAGTGNPAATFTTANLSSGSKMVAIVALNSGSGTLSVTGVSDGTNSFTSAGSDTVDNTTSVGPAWMHCSVWILDTPSGDVGTKPTITATNSAGNGGAIQLFEISGLGSGTDLDGSVAFSSITTTASTNNNNPSYTSGAASELLLEIWTDYGGNNLASFAQTPSTGFTLVTDPGTNGNAQIAVAYKNSTGASEGGAWLGQSYQSSWAVMLAAIALKLPGSTTLPPDLIMAQMKGNY